MSGLSQAGFARALGTLPSRYSTYLTGAVVPSASWYLRALRLGQALRTARDQGWLTPVGAAREIRRALDEGETGWAWRLLLQCRDHLHLALDGWDSGAAWEAVPARVGSQRWDHLLAAVIGHEFEIRGLAPPAWTVTPVPTDTAWVFQSPFFTEGEVLAATPEWLAERGIFVAARDLVTA